jgi:hypothetical protein
MGISVSTTNGVLKTPGAKATFTAENTASGTATQGVLAFVGEADEGPRFSIETRLRDNSFGPDAKARVKAKYGSGPLVDAFVAAAQAANDPQIPGTFDRVILVKTNTGVAASATLAQIGSGSFKVASVRAGAPGNQVSLQVTAATADAEPTTTPLLILPPQVSTIVNFRVNGGAVVTTTLTAAQAPSSMVTAINALTGVAATGGVSRAVLTLVAGSITLTVDSGFQCHATITGGSFANLPLPGDLIYLPTGSPFATANEGSWVCTAASGSRIDMYKLLDAAGAGTVRTTPTAEGPIAIAATTDFQGWSPSVISNEVVSLPGAGKTLEIANSGSALFSDIAYTFASASATPPAAKSTQVSTAALPTVVAPATELSVDIDVVNQAAFLDDHIRAGGQVALQLGYAGTTASAVVSASDILTITVAGGSGTSPAPISLAAYPTIASLASYIGSLTGFKAAPGTGAAGQRPATELDVGTYTFATEQGALTGRIKRDAADLVSHFASDTGQVVLSGAAPTALPATASLAYLSGGTRGGTTDADFSAAFDALASCDFNFLVPCVSQDATADIAAGLTDSASTYTLAATLSNGKSRALAQSTFKVGRPCLAIFGAEGTFDAQRALAGTLASPRCALAINDPVIGGVVRPAWYTACKAAGMQSGAGYRAIFSKGVNVDGSLHPGAGFNSDLQSDLDSASDASLLVLKERPQGGFIFSFDQTTYLRDNNAVYNSIGAMYRADIVARTLASRTDSAFTGVNISDMSASLARTVVERILNDLRRDRWIAPSDEAPLGWRNLNLRKEGVSTFVDVEVFDNVANAFTIINVLVREPTQTA